MSWEDQGRQYHMWFGNGTAGNKATKAAPGSSVVGQSTADRILALAYGALASLPTAHRGQAEAQCHDGTLPRLKEAMTAWMRGTALNQAAFAGRFFGRGADDPVVRDLHDAALRTATATTHDDLREAAGKLAEAMETGRHPAMAGLRRRRRAARPRPGHAGRHREEPAAARSRPRCDPAGLPA